MRLFVQVPGVDVITLRTKALIEAARTGLKFGVDEAAFILQEEEKIQVPVDTGRLRDSIHTEVVEDTPTRYTKAVAPVSPEANDQGFTPAYARAVEYGYHSINKAGRMQNTPAQPFVRPSVDTTTEEMKSAIKNGIFEQLDAVRR